MSRTANVPAMIVPSLAKLKSRVSYLIIPSFPWYARTPDLPVVPLAPPALKATEHAFSGPIPGTSPISGGGFQECAGFGYPDGVFLCTKIAYQVLPDSFQSVLLCSGRICAAQVAVASELQ